MACVAESKVKENELDEPRLGPGFEGLRQCGIHVGF